MENTVHPPIVHFDTDKIDQLAACGYDLDVQGPDSWSTNPARVTCSPCKATLEAPAPREPAPLRCTISLEVLTPPLRAIANAVRRQDMRIPDSATVAIVKRLGLEPVAVPEVDAEWRSVWNHEPTDILARLLRQARMYADAEPDTEVLMPGPDVLAALAGRPVGGYTAAVPSRYDVVQPGWFVLVEVRTAAGEQDFVWLLVEDTRACDDRECPRPGCAILTVRGQGIRHHVGDFPVGVRIPASTAVEQ